MKKVYVILMVGLLAFAPKRIFNSSPQTLPFTQDWTNIGLIITNDDWSGVAGIQGFLGDDAAAGTGVDPQIVLIDYTTQDVIANQTNPNALTTGGVAEFHITDPVVALQGSGTADFPNIIIFLNTTTLQNINVAYNLRDIDGSVDNSIQPVAMQYRVGNTGNFTNVPAGFVADATTGPSLATLVTPVSAQLPAACNNQPEVQVRVITSNAVGNDEWVGIDDINITGTPQAPTVYTWIGGNSTWNTPTNWTPTRSTPAVTDILQFNDGTTVTVSAVPTETFARLLLSNNSTVNLQAGVAGNILTITGDAGTDLDVPAGSVMNINGTNALTITLSTGATGAVAGNMTFSNAAHKMDAADANSITFSSPAVFTQGSGCTGNVFTNLGAQNVIIFGTGTTFLQQDGSNPFGLGQPDSKVVFQAGSLFKYQSSTLPSFSGRTYANFELDFAAATLNATGSNALSIDNLTITQGTLNLGMTATPGHSIKGNISIASGATLNFNPATPGTLNLNGTTNQTISNNGMLTSTINQSFVIFKTSGSVILSTNAQLSNLTISGSNTLDLNGNTLSMIGDMTNGGTLTTGLGTVDFVGTSGTQLLTSGGTGVGKTFYNISHTGASTLQLATNPLRVISNFTNNAGPFNGSNLNVTVGGNFSSTGTYTPGSGILTFDGAANQTWSNNPGNTYHDVIINKAAGTITLNNAVSLDLTAVLTLTNGTITLGNNNLILANSSPDPAGAIATASPTSYIVTNGTGALQRAVSGAGFYGFPVGYSTVWQPASITFAAPLAGGPNTLSARFIAGYAGIVGALPPNESGHTINRISVVGYWEIIAGAPISDSYDALIIANAFGDILDYARLHLLKRDNAISPWTLNGTHVPTGGSNPQAIFQRLAMSGFSQYAIGGEQNVSLPVNILSFSGYKDGSRNQLRWTTATEQNNRGFEVQRSTDGINFSAIGFVNSLAPGGNSSDQVNYSFTDNAPAGTKQYYRLRQEDLAGASRLSNIVFIRGGKPAGLSIDALFPNPAKNYVNLQVSSPESDKVTIIVTDMAGRNMIRQVNGIGAGSNTLALDISKLQRGMYLVRVVGGDGTVRFVK